MTFEGDDPVEIPAGMYDSDSDADAVLAPIFVGNRMQAELIRSLLEASDIPAVVFGESGYAFGSDNVSVNERVMVRSDQVEAALETIRTADVSTGEVIEPTEDDFEVMVDADYDVDEDGERIDWTDAEEFELLADRSDWGPRIAGLIGVAALIVTAVVLISKAT